MARKPLTAVTGLLVLGTALLTIVATGASAQDANACDKPWPYNAGCKGAVAPADGRKVRLITTNPLSLRKDEPAQPAAPVLVQPPVPAQPPVVAQTEEPQQQPAVRRRNNPFLAPAPAQQQPSVEPEVDTPPQTEQRPAPRILQRAPARPQVAEVDPEQRTERFERPDRFDRRERTERFEQPARTERFEQPERFGRQERFEPTPRFERTERFDRPERVERNEERFERGRGEERFERGRGEARERRGPIASNDDAPRRERRWCMRGGREFPCPW